MAFESDTEPDIDALVADLKDDNGNVRQKACRALSRLGPAAVPTLVLLLGDENGPTRTSAMNALLTMRNPAEEAAPALVDSLDHESDAIRDSAIWTLTVIGRAAEPILQEALYASNGRMEDGIARALAGIAARAEG